MRDRLIGAGARTALLAGFLMAAASPALAAAVEWRVGPLGLAGGQILQVGFMNLETFSCEVGVAVSATAANVPRTGAVTATRTTVVDTTAVPNLVLPNAGLIVGYTDPNLMPGERRLLQGRVVCDCRGVTASAMRRLPVTMEIVDRATGEVRAALPGVAQ